MKKILLLCIGVILMFVFACGSDSNDENTTATPQTTSIIKGIVTDSTPLALQLKISLFEIDLVTDTSKQAAANFKIPKSSGTDTVYLNISHYTTTAESLSDTNFYVNVSPLITYNTTYTIVASGTAAYTIDFANFSDSVTADTQLFGVVIWMDASSVDTTLSGDGKWNFGSVKDGVPSAGTEIAGFYMGGAFQYYLNKWNLLDIENSALLTIKDNSNTGFDITIKL